MKKWICVLLALGMLLSLYACGEADPPDFSSLPGNNSSRGTTTNPGAANDQTENQSAPSNSTSGDLSFLYHMQRKYDKSFTENGYYYLTLEEDRLADGQRARHLMYMDFATQQEIYLCSNAACSHNTVDCTSVFPSDEFSQSTALFIMNDTLYILSKEQDHDGSAVMGVLGDHSGVAVEATPTLLYKANLDGTGREKLYTFDSSVTVEDLVLGDGNGLYVITKKVTTEQGDGYTYQTSSNRNLCYLDLSTGKENELFSMDFGDGIDWDVIGCTGRKLVLYGIDFGRDISPEEQHSDDNSRYDNSSDVFAALDVDSGECKEIYRVHAPKARSYEVDKRQLYYSVSGEGKITSVDLQTAEQKTLCTISQDSIMGIIGEQLYTVDDNDKTLYFINTESGSISHCGLVEKTIGTSLKIIAATSNQVLVIYDTDATPKSDGSFTVYGYQYALISKDDLFSGRDNFKPIKMTGSGL